ncbi:conserved hypothetical protein [Candidatus Methylobacter favarea]|uniref:Uncharacterized protein n=1 Tax=Candidatus Methylobacter favarea TaxID=2707345 RepID=A0A8S0X374_9GAMM|nr:conserved hypothetical protein [Candidatus Methylobacter favarea]
MGSGVRPLIRCHQILLNHCAVMKIRAVRMEQSQIELALPDPHPAAAKALAKWL